MKGIHTLGMKHFLFSMGLVFLYSYVLTLIAYKSKILKWLLFVSVAFLYLVRLFLATYFGTNIGPNILMLLLETTGKESAEFLNVYVFNVTTFKLCVKFIVRIAPFLLFILLNKYVASFFANRGSIAISAICVIGFICGIPSLMNYSKLFGLRTMDELSNWEMTTYNKDPITDIVYSVFYLRTAGNELKYLIAATEEACREDNLVLNTDSINVVLVIGESHIKAHSSIYGYPLETEPNLRCEQEKILFQIVCLSNRG